MQSEQWESGVSVERPSDEAMSSSATDYSRSSDEVLLSSQTRSASGQWEVKSSVPALLVHR